MQFLFVILTLLTAVSTLVAQEASINGRVLDGRDPLPFVNLYLKDTSHGTATDEAGYFNLDGLGQGRYVLVVSAMGYREFSKVVSLGPAENRSLTIVMEPLAERLDETVVTGTLKPVRRPGKPCPGGGLYFSLPEKKPYPQPF